MVYEMESKVREHVFELVEYMNVNMPVEGAFWTLKSYGESAVHSDRRGTYFLLDAGDRFVNVYVEAEGVSILSSMRYMSNVYSVPFDENNAGSCLAGAVYCLKEFGKEKKEDAHLYLRTLESHLLFCAKKSNEIRRAYEHSRLTMALRTSLEDELRDLKALLSEAESRLASLRVGDNTDLNCLLIQLKTQAEVAQ